MTDRSIPFFGPMVRALLREIEQPGTGKTQTRRVLMATRNGTRVEMLASADRPVSTRSPFNDADQWGFPYYDVSTDSTEFMRLPDYAKRLYDIGDRLWVKETWADVNLYGAPGIAYRANGDVRDLMEEPDFHCDDGSFNYDDDRLQFGKRGLQWSTWADDLLGGVEGSWRPSIFMPRWASRLTLNVTEVRIERLQEISEADARAEGIERLKSGRGFYDPTEGHGAVHLGHWFPRATDAFEVLWDDLNAKRGFGWDTNPWVVAVTFTVRRGNIDHVAEVS